MSICAVRDSADDPLSKGSTCLVPPTAPRPECRRATPLPSKIPRGAGGSHHCRCAPLIRRPLWSHLQFRDPSAVEPRPLAQDPARSRWISSSLWVEARRRRLPSTSSTSTPPPSSKSSSVGRSDRSTRPPPAMEHRRSPSTGCA
jgi:hypothetical protein